MASTQARTPTQAPRRPTATVEAVDLGSTSRVKDLSGVQKLRVEGRGGMIARRRARGADRRWMVEPEGLGLRVKSRGSTRRFKGNLMMVEG
eukprot:480519-Rhodomonas_salina.2